MFDTEAQVDSNYKRLQRFFRSFELKQDSVSKLLGGWLNKTEGWILCLDRTNWKVGKVNINLLVLAVAYQGVAIPLMWTSLGKAGNSNTKERCLLLTRFIRLFGGSRIRYLTADREFRGKNGFTI